MIIINNRKTNKSRSGIEENDKGYHEKNNCDSYDVTKSKKYIYRLLLFVIFIGLLVPFSCQFLVPFIFQWNGKRVLSIPGAEVWNTYVSIILGIVATVTSLISLILSFKNTDDAKETSVETMRHLTAMSTKINQMINEQQQIAREQTEFSKDLIRIKDRLNLSETDIQTVDSENVNDFIDFDDNLLESIGEDEL